MHDKMKKKWYSIPLKIIGWLLALSIVFFSASYMVSTLALVQIRAFFDMPKVQEHSIQYVEQMYPGTDFAVEEPLLNFIDNCYRVKVVSPSSPDTYFTLTYDYDLVLTKDSYTQDVIGGRNTFNRLEAEYTALVNEAVPTVGKAYCVTADFSLKLKNSSLELDRQYDVGSLGQEYGKLKITLIDEARNMNVRRLDQLLHELDDAFAAQGIGYTSIDLTLRTDNEYDHPEHTEFDVSDVTPEDIHSDDSLSRIQTLWDKQEAKRQEIRADYEKND